MGGESATEDAMSPVLKDGEIVARYNSTRNPANVYDVTRLPDGTLWCSCPGHRFSKEAPKACRHTKRVLAGLDDDAAILERQERTALLVQALRAAKLALGEAAGRFITAHHPPGDARETAAAERLLVAIEAVGLTAPPPERTPVRGASRGFRVITLDD
jgi:hypothetical protein